MKIRRENGFSIFPSKSFIEFFGRKDDSFIKGLDQVADFTHMSGSIGAAKKNAAWLQHLLYILAHLPDILAVKQYMICNYKIKAADSGWNVMAVKSFKRKAGITAYGTSGIAEHAGRNIRKGDMYL